MKPILFLAVFLVCCAVSTIPFFPLAPGETKCFINDVPRDTALYTSSFLVEVVPAHGGGGVDPALTRSLKVWIEDPEGKRVAEAPEAENGFTTHTSAMHGEYKACVTTSVSRWSASNTEFHVALTFRDGVEAIDYRNVAKTEELNALQLKLRKVQDRIAHIRNEQGYQRARDLEYRKVSELTSRRVFLWSFLQVIVFAFCTVFQLYSLKTFFKKNKIY